LTCGFSFASRTTYQIPNRAYQFTFLFFFFFFFLGKFLHVKCQTLYQKNMPLASSRILTGRAQQKSSPASEISIFSLANHQLSFLQNGLHWDAGERVEYVACVRTWLVGERVWEWGASVGPHGVGEAI
jgi:hypothetical protein